MEAESIAQELGRDICRRYVDAVLSSVKQYHGAARVDLVSVATKDVRPLSRLAVEARLKKAREMLTAVQECGAAPFELIIVDDGSRKLRLVFPPVVEKQNAGLFLMDGVHRFMAAMQAGVERIYCAIVEGVDLPPLPCAASTWEGLVIVTEQRTIEDVLPGIDKNLFRHLTSLFNGDGYCFSDSHEALNFVQNMARGCRRKERTSERVQLDETRRDSGKCSARGIEAGQNRVDRNGGSDATER